MSAQLRVTLMALLTLTVVCSVAQDCLCQEEGNTYDLSKVHGVRRLDDKGALTLLAKNGFVVRPVYYKQIFQPYIGGGLPKYVTTDSVFRTYHVILEESVRDMEKSNAATIRDFSARAARAALKELSEAKIEQTRKAARMLAAYFSLAA